MIEVDRRLREEGTDIPSRLLGAYSIISEESGITIVFGDELSNRINEWFERRYGDRLKVDFSIGRTVVLIDGDPYSVKFPTIFGRVKLFPLRWVEDVTLEHLATRATEELESLTTQIIDRFEDFSLLSNLSAKVVADLSPSVDHIMTRPPHYGLSRWASLQASEKVLKHAISADGKTPPKIHNLGELAHLANKLGVSGIETNLVDTVQCKPSVRYDEPVTLYDAIAAHHASVRLCRQVAEGSPSLGVHVGVDVSEKSF